MHELKHLVGGVLAALALWSLMSLDLGMDLLLLAAMSVTVTSSIKPSISARIPDVAWRILGPVLLLFVAADFLMHLPAFIPSLVRMVVGLLLFRVLAPRSKREDLQLVLVCLFCLVMSGVMTVSFLFAFQILIFTPLAMGLLFLICLLDRGAAVLPFKPSWVEFSVARLVKRVWEVLDFRVLFLGGVMFGFVVLVSTMLFVLTPRFSLDQKIPFLELAAQPQTGIRGTGDAR